MKNAPFFIFAIFAILGIALSLCCGPLTYLCSPPAQAEEILDYRGFIPETPRIRVALTAHSVPEIAIRGPYKAEGFFGDLVLSGGDWLAPGKLVSGSLWPKIGHQEWKISALRLVPEIDGSLYVNNRPYRGELHIIRQPSGEFILVNAVNMENYLGGVLGGEMPLYWSDAALKAQIIAARTYALWRKKTTTNPYYDLTDSTFSQVYKGKTAETSKARRLVRETGGVILIYNGKILPAFYHSTCGGRTVDVSLIWPEAMSVRPLAGTKCGFCEHSKFSSWTASLSSEELAQKISPASPHQKIESIEFIRVIESKYGVVTKVEVLYSSGKFEFTGEEFRILVGPTTIKSSKFEVKKEGERFRFQGRGFGHGVGMCQVGAGRMGARGFSAVQILKHYYPGAGLVRIY
jgi:stage II sporulation protein D